MTSAECRTGRSPTTDKELRLMARRVWLDRGIAVLWPEEIANEFDRQTVVNVAEKSYGRRRDDRDT